MLQIATDLNCSSFNLFPCFLRPLRRLAFSPSFYNISDFCLCHDRATTVIFCARESGPSVWIAQPPHIITNMHPVHFATAGILESSTMPLLAPPVCRSVARSFVRLLGIFTLLTSVCLLYIVSIFCSHFLLLINLHLCLL